MSEPRSILLVEDDLSIRSTLAEILESEGYHLICAAHGKEALELLRRGARPDLMLVDLTMPVMDGAAFLETCESEGLCQGVPAYIFSATHMIPEIGRAHGIINKPTNLDSIFEIVRRHCGQPDAPPLSASI